MSAESKSKKQPDYSLPWKVTCDTVSQKCKINLYNIRCTQAGHKRLSQLRLKKIQLAVDTLN